MKNTKLKNCVGGHDIVLYTGCRYDPAVRKYRDGNVLCRIPFSGTMLNAYREEGKNGSLPLDGCEVPLREAETWKSVDPLPSEQECDYCIVSAMYVAACKALGMRTDRLLTLGGVVVDQDDHPIGACWLNRN